MLRQQALCSSEAQQDAMVLHSSVNMCQRAAGTGQRGAPAPSRLQAGGAQRQGKQHPNCQSGGGSRSALLHGGVLTRRSKQTAQAQVSVVGCPAVSVLRGAWEPWESAQRGPGAAGRTWRTPQAARRATLTAPAGSCPSAPPGPGSATASCPAPPACLRGAQAPVTAWCAARGALLRAANACADRPRPLQRVCSSGQPRHPGPFF